MLHIVHLCDGVYKNIDAGLGPEKIEHEDRVLYRFMDRFYIRSETEDLTPVEVSELCRARASDPASIGKPDSVVQHLFKALVHQRRPKHLLEIGAGTNPILQVTDPLLDDAKMLYVKCDADPGNTNGNHVFSGQNSSLPYDAEFFEMAIAVFVLHFHFYAEQIAELHRCLAPSGVFVANVYRRTPKSLERLSQSFVEKGFVVKTMLDPKGLCHDHHYWAISKDRRSAENAISELKVLVARQAS